MPKVYVIGSLRNPKIPEIANKIREAGFEVFDDWYAAGPEADDKWKEYEQGRGRGYSDALSGAAATNVYEFDKRNLDSSDAVVLVLPAGRSGHLELGYCLGKGTPGFILLEDGVDRWDVMYKFANGVTDNLDHIIKHLKIRDFSKPEPGSWQQVGAVSLRGLPKIMSLD
jgi:nucleoside 2-deoxyribosyltransferase